jgi:hypothetical protein
MFFLQCKYYWCLLLLALMTYQLSIILKILYAIGQGMETRRHNFLTWQIFWSLFYDGRAFLFQSEEGGIMLPLDMSYSAVKAVSDAKRPARRSGRQWGWICIIFIRKSGIEKVRLQTNSKRRSVCAARECFP